MSKWGTEGATPKSLHRVAQGGCPAPSPLVASAALSLAPGVGALFFSSSRPDVLSHGDYHSLRIQNTIQSHELSCRPEELKPFYFPIYTVSYILQ